MKCVISYLLIAYLMAPTLLEAATIVSPSGYENISGPTGYGDPFQTQSHFQQVYAASELTSMVGHRITGIAFRVDEEDITFNGDHSGGTTNIEVSASITPIAVDSLTSDLTANRGPNPIVVRPSGAFLSPPLEGDLAVNPFDLKIPFAEPFLYTGGNLLVEMKVNHSEGPIQIFPLMDAVNAIDGVNVAHVTFGIPHAGEASYGLVTQFEFTPEPSSLAIAALASIGLLLSRLERPTNH